MKSRTNTMASKDYVKIARQYAANVMSGKALFVRMSFQEH